MIRLFKVFVPASVLILLISEAILIFSSYLAATIFLIDFDPGVFLLYDAGIARILTVVALVMLGLYFHDLYNDFRVGTRLILLQQISLVIGVAFIAQALISYVNKDWILPKWIMIYGSVAVMVVLFCWRILFSVAFQSVSGGQKVLFLGSSPTNFQVADHLRERLELGMTPMGYLDENAASPEAPALKRLGTIADLVATVNEIQPERIVVGMQERRNRLPVTELLELRFSGIQTEEIASLYENTLGRVCTREIRPSQLIFSSELGPRRHSVQFQTMYSTLIALIGLIIALPIMAIVALLVRLSSSGPILLRQTRVGIYNKDFTVLKFRSMYQDAEARTGAVWASKNDPRITPIGRWLRLLRLDELPQLINVVRGDMSIVGPRPERPEFVKTLSEQIPFYRQRHCVKPGITGWAQINYKYGNSIEDTITKLEYDLYYIKHISLSLDLYIMFHTAKTMLLFRGAQ